MYRELTEEVGLAPRHVSDPGAHAPLAALRRAGPRGCGAIAAVKYRGQKQIWYLLRLLGRDCDVCLRRSEKPEFDAWRWSEYWVPLDSVIEFKREVYYQALCELSRFLPGIASRRPHLEPCQPSDAHRTAWPARLRHTAIGRAVRQRSAVTALNRHRAPNLARLSACPVCSRAGWVRLFQRIFTLPQPGLRTSVLHCRCRATKRQSRPSESKRD